MNNVMEGKKKIKKFSFVKQIILKYKITFVVLLLELMSLLVIAIWTGRGSDLEYYHFDNPDVIKEILLVKGTYRAYINYESDDPVNAITFISESSDRAFQADTLQLYPWKQSDYLQLWAYDDVPDVSLAYYDSTGNTRITNIMIVKTTESRKMLLFIIFAVMIGVDCIFIWLIKLRKTSEKKGNFVIRTGLILLAIAIVSRPLLIDSLLEGDDLLFHLVRIEGIKDAILTGQFPARIQTNWFEGAGYALSVFYGDLLLYIAAFLRILGFSLQASYKIYLFVITLGTAGITYYALNKACANKWASTVGTVSYILGTYRFCNMYKRAAVGEFSAMMFTPLVICGFYCIFTKAIKRDNIGDNIEESKRYLWIMPAFGMAGILTTHCITSLMVTFALFLWCIFNFRVLFRKEIFICICKTVIATVFLSAGWLVPFADYMINTSVAINQTVENSIVRIQSAGITVGKMFALIPDCNNYQVFGAIYFLMILLAMCRITMNTVRYKKVEDNEKQVIKLIFVFGILAICSTNVFPWDILCSLSRVAGIFAGTIQFPSRFVAVMQFMSILIFVNIFSAELQKEKVNKEKNITKTWNTNGTIELTLIGIMVIFLGVMVSSSFVNHPIRYKIYDSAGTGLFIGYGTYSTFIVYSGEYLPNGVNILEYRWQNVYPDEGVTITSYQKEGTKVTMEVKNSSNEEKAIGLPLLYYRGYKAEYKNGDQMDAYSGKNSMVTVNLPGYYSGMITVNYYVPWYWRTAEIVSVISVFYIVLLILKGRFYRKRPF